MTKSNSAQIFLPPKLVDVFSGKADVRGAWGGRGSAKTRSFATMSAVMAYKYAMAGISGQVLCAREHMNSLKDSSLAEVKQAILSIPWLNDFFDCGENYIKTRPGVAPGHVYYTFEGLRLNVDSIKSRARILLCWVDEAEKVSEEAWGKLLPTLREEVSELWVTWNPESPYSATHKRFREAPPANSKIVKVNYDDNPWFPDILKRLMEEDRVKRPDTFAHIWLGEFNENIKGAVYAQFLATARDDGRIGPAPYKPGVPVITAWDLGRADSTAIWFAQVVGLQPRIIDFYENNMQPLDHYADVVRKKPYTYKMHYLPHDGKHERLGMRGSIKDQLREMGLQCTTLAQTNVEPGINLARTLIRECWFDSDKCAKGLDALKYYQFEYDEERQVYKATPRHDWTSHAADAFRYLAHALNEPDEVRLKAASLRIEDVMTHVDSWMG